MVINNTTRFVIYTSLIKGFFLLTTFGLALLIGNKAYGEYAIALNFIVFSSSFLQLGISNNLLTSKIPDNIPFSNKILKILIFGLIWLILSILMKDKLSILQTGSIKYWIIYPWMIAYTINLIYPNFLISSKLKKDLGKIAIPTILSLIILSIIEYYTRILGIYLIILIHILQCTFFLVYYFTANIKSFSPALILQRNRLDPINNTSFKYWVADILWAIINYLVVIEIYNNSIEALGDYTLYNQIIFTLLFIPTILSPIIINQVSVKNSLTTTSFLRNKLNQLGVIIYAIGAVLSYPILLIINTFEFAFKINLTLFLFFLISGFLQLVYSQVMNYLLASQDFLKIYSLKILPKTIVLVWLLVLPVNNLEEVMIIQALGYSLVILYYFTLFKR